MSGQISGEGPRKAKMDEAISALTGLAPGHFQFPAAMRSLEGSQCPWCDAISRSASTV